jgi:hypothetical protein
MVKINTIIIIIIILLLLTLEVNWNVLYYTKKILIITGIKTNRVGR